MRQIGKSMAGLHHQLFIVKSNDGKVVRLSAFEKLLDDGESIEVVIDGWPPGQINHPYVKVGRLIAWSPYSHDLYEIVPNSDEMQRQYEIVRRRVASRPDIHDDANHVLFVRATVDGYHVRTRSDRVESSAQPGCLSGNVTLSLGMIQDWAVRLFRQPRLSPAELAELERRTNAACELFGWPDLGKQYDAIGEHEQTRNIAYFMLNREMPFRAAAFEYVAALEKGSRKIAPDTELDSAAASLLDAIVSQWHIGHWEKHGVRSDA
jgi:hypothetical protein